MDLKHYRASESEQKRTQDLMRLISLLPKGKSVLDIGARDGHFSVLLTEHYENVTALDLEKPLITHPKIHCVQGNITQLNCSDNAFDLVFCAEVLEHIPSHLLQKACAEIGRVSNEYLLIGVPYKQDIRVGRTTCYSCGKKNPPWGHVNRFDTDKLQRLFPAFHLHEVSFVGETDMQTNFLSAFLMDLAGNPYGTYEQEETCIQCGEKLKTPPERSLLQKIYTKLAFYIQSIQKPFCKAHPNWIHLVFRRKTA